MSGIVSATAYGRGRNEFQEFENSLSKDNMEKHLGNVDDAEDILSISVPVFAASVATFVVSKILYDRSQSQPNVNAGIGIVAPSTPGAYVRVTF